jgi:DNA (cytosine-5)-methyltransferase 1
MGDAFKPGLEGQPGHGDGARGRAEQAGSTAEADGGDVGDSDIARSSEIRSSRSEGGPPSIRAGRGQWNESGNEHRPNGSFWSDHEWLACHDGKARRTKPGLRLLADGVAGRVHQWHIAGNGIVIPLAVEVLAALKEMMIEEWGWEA